MGDRELGADLCLLLMLDECEWRASCPDTIYFWEEATLLFTMQDAD